MPPLEDKSYYNTSKFEICLAKSCIDFHNVHRNCIKTVINGDGTQFKADTRLVMHFQQYKLCDKEGWISEIRNQKDFCLYLPWEISCLSFKLINESASFTQSTNGITLVESVIGCDWLLV